MIPRPVFPSELYRITDELDLAFTTFHIFPRTRKVYREEMDAALFRSGATKNARYIPGQVGSRMCRRQSNIIEWRLIKSQISSRAPR